MDSKKGDTSEDVFIPDGEMGALMRSYNWSQTSLGAIKNWPQSLKTSIRIILGSRYPMFIWWGEELISFYNDAYISKVRLNCDHTGWLLGYYSNQRHWNWDCRRLSPLCI